MRLLGIDYGSKHVGIAMSDEAGQFAIPTITLDASKNLLEEVVTMARKNDVKEIVMGESKDYNGKANTIMEKSLDFKKSLESAGFIVHLEPEFMTSIQAERFQGKNDMSDASAAALILQSFLDKKPNKK